MLPAKTTTIEEFIESGKQSTITYFNLSFIEKLSNGTWVSVLNVITDYLDELSDYTVNVELSGEEQLVYFYKPKLLCYDIYGNPELYFIILLLNNMADVKEFTKPVIKMLKKEHMNTLLGLIYNAEKTALDNYNKRSGGLI